MGIEYFCKTKSHCTSKAYVFIQANMGVTKELTTERVVFRCDAFSIVENGVSWTSLYNVSLFSSSLA